MGSQPRAKPDFSLLQGVRAYQPYRPEPEQNPPQSVSGVVPFQQPHYTDAPMVMAQSGPIPWGITTQQAADALTSVFGQAAPEPISDDSGARDCLVWYDKL